MTAAVAITAAAVLAALAPRPASSADAPAAAAQLKSRTVTIRCAESRTYTKQEKADVDLVLLPAGTVTLRDADGRDRAHAVKPVWISRYETRWDEIEIFWRGLDLPEREQRERWPELRKGRMESPWAPPWEGLDEDGQRWTSPPGTWYPANCIHFQAARRYVAWLSEHTGKKFRLPTEAEWEYACRAGGPPVKPDAEDLDAVAWHAGNSGGKPQPAGKKRPNAWGLYDMLGNVGEFVIRDPKDDKGLLAGGSYRDEAKDVHSAAREPYSPAWQKNDEERPPSTSWLNWTVHHVGFRVVMEDDEDRR
jgi:formylglycine-generating enzyme required for sulfatase activity